jgi:hypothetical protein
MGRFYFHLRDGDRLIRDQEGQDLPNTSEALREALLAARELLAEAIRSGRERVPEAIVITDESGCAIKTVPLAAVFPKPFKT